jgi:hypothetical protein
MAVGELSDEAVVAALRAHPELRKRVSSIVLARAAISVRDAAGASQGEGEPFGVLAAAAARHRRLRRRSALRAGARQA